MKDTECVTFLQWALPRLRLYWPGYRKVRGLVCKRVARRMRQLGVAYVAALRLHLERNPAEWQTIEALCSIPISRFYRDRGIFERLEREVLPALADAVVARNDTVLDCWSAGCASGEEPYTLAILWHLRLKARFPGLCLRVLATDIDLSLLERAAAGCYRRSSLKELPPVLRDTAFDHSGYLLCVREELRRDIAFSRQDVRTPLSGRQFDLILCRNLVLTYFQPRLQRDAMGTVLEALRFGGALVIGSQESPPDGLPALMPWPGARCIYRKLGSSVTASMAAPSNPEVAP